MATKKIGNVQFQTCIWYGSQPSQHTSIPLRNLHVSHFYDHPTTRFGQSATPIHECRIPIRMNGIQQGGPTLKDGWWNQPQRGQTVCSLTATYSLSLDALFLSNDRAGIQNPMETIPIFANLPFPPSSSASPVLGVSSSPSSLIFL